MLSSTLAGDEYTDDVLQTAFLKNSIEFSHQEKAVLYIYSDLLT